MIENKQNPSQPLNWFLFCVSVLFCLLGIIMLLHNPADQTWRIKLSLVIWVLSPLYFYNEIVKYREGFTKVSVTTDRMWKCRVSGTDEVFYIKADSEKEAELFFETMLEGKNVFIEESNIKLLGFNIQTPNKL